MKRVNLFLVSMATAVSVSWCFSSCGGNREKLSQALAKYDKFESFSEGLAAVAKDGKYGYINKSGEEVVPCIYAGVSSFSDGFAIVRNNRKVGVIDKSGKEILPCDYDNVYRWEETFYEQLRGNIAIVDEKGIIVPAGYDYVIQVKNADDLIAVGIDKNGYERVWGFMDRATKKEIIPCIYEIQNNDNWGYQCSFSEGLISVGKNFKYGLIDKTGKQVMPFRYVKIDDFSEGLALVWTAAEEWYRMGYIDKTGKEIIPCVYENASPFSEGLACVKKNDKYGFIDKNGKEAIPFIYNMTSEGDDVGVQTCFKNGLAVLRVNDGKGSSYDYDAQGTCGVIDKTGKIIIPFIYSNIWSQDNNLFVCSVYTERNGTHKCGILDKTGKEIVPFNYSSINQTADNYYVVTLNEKQGLLDSKGKEIVQCQYNSIDIPWDKPLVQNGLIFVEKNKKYGFIDKTGKEIIPCVFENRVSCSDGLVRCKWNGQEGYLDTGGYFIGKETVKKIEN
jgi:hypothetical protein